jgi:hypothetical protein
MSQYASMNPRNTKTDIKTTYASIDFASWCSQLNSDLQQKAVAELSSDSVIY